MTKLYPMELRERALRFVKASESRNAVARRLGGITPAQKLRRQVKTPTAA